MKEHKAQHLVSWREYERAMFNDLYYCYRPPEWRVEPDLRTLRGLISRAHRQVDVAVFAAEALRPEIAVECRRYGRRLNITDVEGFLSKLEDLGAMRGVLVAPLGFSPAAVRRARSAPLELFQLPEEDAQRLSWRELARAVFPWDEGFHPQLGTAFHTLVVDKDVDQCIEAMEELPFEEWDCAIRALVRLKPAATATLLDTIAQFHPDDGWRYNAVRLLDEVGALDRDRVDELLEHEIDADTLELLHELRRNGPGA